MNIMSYLNQPSFEDFVDSPAVTDLAHNTASPTGEAAPAVAAVTEAPATNIEIPESTGPELVASADEAQAAAIVEDPGHSEAEQMAQAATAQDTALLESAEVTPGAETAVVEETTETPAGTETTIDEVSTDAVSETDTTTDVSGDGTDTGGELGDVAADTGSVDATTDTPLEETTTTTDETTEGDASAEEPVVEETTTEEPVTEEPLEEDGLGEVTEPETEETEDGLGDGTSGDTETGETETNTDDQEAGGEETESEEETSEEESSEEEGGEEESTEETSEEVGEDDEDGIDYDIPDIDTETTDEDVDTAEEEAAEAVAEEEELDAEIVDTSKSVNELDKEEVAVEAFISVLSHGVNSKKFTPQTVALAQAKLQELATQFGSESPVIPSMEDYTVNNLGEYYTNSLESFSDFLKKIRHARKNFFDDFAQKMNDKMHLKAVETQIDALNKVADQQIVRLKDLELEGPVTIAIPGPVRSKDGVIKGTTSELQWLNEIAPVFKLDHAYLEGIAKILKEAVAEGDSDKAASLANKALKLSVPAKKYPASAFSGNPNVEMKFVKSEAKATGSLTDDMKTLGTRAIPQIESAVNPFGVGEKKGEFKKAELVKMLQICKVLIGLSRGTAASVGKPLVDQIDVANRTSTDKDMSDKKSGDKEAQRRAEAALSQLVTQFWYGVSFSLDNYSSFQWRLIAIIDGLLQIVKKAKATPEKKI